MGRPLLRDVWDLYRAGRSDCCCSLVWHGMAWRTTPVPNEVVLTMLAPNVLIPYLFRRLCGPANTCCQHLLLVVCYDVSRQILGAMEEPLDAMVDSITRRELRVGIGTCRGSWYGHCGQVDLSNMMCATSHGAMDPAMARSDQCLPVFDG